MMCQMPHHAATRAMPPCPPKKVKVRISPRPEFWIPVSMAMLRLFPMGQPNASRQEASPPILRTQRASLNLWVAKTPSEWREGLLVTQERHADGSKGCREPVPGRDGHLAGPSQTCAHDARNLSTQRCSSRQVQATVGSGHRTPSRTMALRMVRSFRIRATWATL